MTDQWHIESWDEEMYMHYKKRWMKGITMKYAVLINVDGDMIYVPEDTKVSSNNPKLFDTYEDAVAEQKNWNTGIIVEYTDDRQYKNSIREMTDDERLRAMHRSKMNKRTNS